MRLGEYDTAQNRAAESRSDHPDSDLLSLARRAFDASTQYIDTSLRPQWERNVRAFQSRHPPGSKYFSPDYAHRAKIFRPKTRAAIRSAEAACAAAFFSTADVASVQPGNDENPRQLASARVNQALLQYRLTRTVPWYLTVMGAFQDCQVYGFCVTKQHWVYERVLEGYDEVPVVDPETAQVETESGGPLSLDALATGAGAEIKTRRVPRWRTTKDQPEVLLIPPENVRLDPGADWRDPMQTSPYLIVAYPMYVTEVKAKMRNRSSGRATRLSVEADPDVVGAFTWNEVDDAVLKQSRISVPDQTKQVREAGREPAEQVSQGISDFDLIWVWECFLRVDGQDTHFWSVQDFAFLTEPASTREVYQQDYRPYVMGYGMVEAHRTFPASKVELLTDLQAAANEIQNARLDNLRLSLNGRNFVRAGRGVDLSAVKRSTPGGVVLVREPDDVRVDRPQDVTSSAYAEQDRLNADFDELAGSFSQGSVMTSRQLNETVGGMQILAGHAGAVSEYDLRTFAETWAEKAIVQIVKLEQRFETDPVILALAGRQAELYTRFGISVIDDDLLQQDVTVSVNVGIGATNPAQRMQKLAAAMQLTGQLLGPDLLKVINREEAITEIFGAAGFKDGHRFFNLGDDPKYQQLMAMLEQAQQVIAKLQDDRAAQLAIEKARIEGQLAIEQMRSQTKQTLADKDNQAELVHTAAKIGMQARSRAALENVRHNLDLNRMVAEGQIEQQQHLGQVIAQAISQSLAPVLAQNRSGGPVVLDSHTRQIRDLGEMQAGWERTAQMLQAGMENMFGRISEVLRGFSDELERQRMQYEADSVDVRRRLAEAMRQIGAVGDEMARQRAETMAQAEAIQEQQREVADELARPRHARAEVIRGADGRVTGARIVEE